MGDWIPTLALALTVIGSAWWNGRNTATRDDIGELRAEIRAINTRIDNVLLADWKGA